LDVNHWALDVGHLPKAMPRVSIIVPVLNEAENIEPLVSKIVASGVPFHEILFVDGGSIDGTRGVIESLAARHPVRFMEQDRNAPGLAAAIMAGARAAEADILVVMDADLSHPPERINDLVAPLFSGAADMVIGSRYIPGGSTPGWPFWRRMMSRTASIFAQPLTGVRDAMCGFFAISRSRLLQINPPTSGFKIVFETILRGGRGLRVCEIPIAFRDRTHGKSKMSLGVALKFFVRWLVAILGYPFRR
jgi:dolichol-phosphate mannosyltransferase